MTNGDTTQPQQIVYEYDPVTNIKDESGYWRLSNANSTECKLGQPPKQTGGISPWMLLLVPLGLIGFAAMEGEKKNARTR